MFWLAESTDELSWVARAIMNFFMWIINWIIEQFTFVIESVLDLMPQSWVSQIDSSLAHVQPYFAIINYWVPLDWAFAILAGYLLFILNMIGVKLFIKNFIPTVG